MKVNIPFTPDMAEAVIEGRKSCTTRRKRYGSVGDVFIVESGFRFETLIITELKHHVLETVARNYYKEEGFETPEGFIAKWCELHPTRRWVPNQLVWTNFFEKE